MVDVGPLLLLNNRRVYSTDQNRCKAVQNRIRKAENTEARNRLPPTNAHLTPAGKPRRRFSDVESEDDFPQSDTSVSEAHQNGKHTDSEVEDGQATPIILSTQSTQPVASQAFASMQSTQSLPAGPPSFQMHSHRAKPGRRHSKSVKNDDIKMTAAETAKDKKRSAKKSSTRSKKSKKTLLLFIMFKSSFFLRRHYCPI